MFDDDAPILPPSFIIGVYRPRLDSVTFSFPPRPQQRMFAGAPMQGPGLSHCEALPPDTMGHFALDTANTVPGMAVWIGYLWKVGEPEKGRAAVLFRGEGKTTVVEKTW